MNDYLNARVSLYRQQLWGTGEFDIFLRSPDDEISKRLGDRRLESLATGYRGADPLSLESRIIARLLEETRVLVRPLQGAARQFMLYWTQRFEVSNVKTLIRARMAGEKAAMVAPRLIAMGPFARLDTNALLHAEDLSELFRQLEDGPYADISRHARRAFEESQNPFILDATLDRAYYEGLVRRALPLESQTGRAMHELMGQLVDRINLVWLLRYRFNYGLPPAQVYYLLVSSRYRLQGDMLQQLVGQSDFKSVLALLPAGMRDALAGAQDIMDVFCRLEEVAARRCEQILSGATHPIARAFAYLALRERDLRSVRAILRGRHLRLGEPAIRQAISSPSCAPVS